MIKNIFARAKIMIAFFTHCKLSKLRRLKMCEIILKGERDFSG